MDFTFRNGMIDWRLSRPGRCYSPEEIREAVQQVYPRLVFDASVTGPAELAREIAEGAIIGLMNGPSEMGPRALGGRSIVADPRRAMTRERINRTLKQREPFRPLAPMILAEHYDEFFEDGRHRDAYMLKVAGSSPLCRQLAPAIIHADGTARIQCVDEDGDLFIRRLLESFYAVTGLPLMLNTSFNRRGEPIVETPEDAIDCFLGLKLDGLYLDGSFYRRAE